jgi:hypothetical protein
MEAARYSETSEIDTWLYVFTVQDSSLFFVLTKVRRKLKKKHPNADVALLKSVFFYSCNTENAFILSITQ